MAFKQIFIPLCFSSLFSLHASFSDHSAPKENMAASQHVLDSTTKNERFKPFAFNNAPDLCPLLEKLKSDYQIKIAIETGTFRGGTAAFFATVFEEVHTIDIAEQYYQQARKTLSSFSNIHLHLGSSEKVLAQILPTLKEEPILFYLDAHWNDHWPLLDELEEINKTHHHNCIIIIDDIKVPGRPDIPYDAYGTHECSFEYVKNKIDKLFDSYTIQYWIPADVTRRAKLVILPQ